MASALSEEGAFAAANSSPRWWSLPRSGCPGRSVHRGDWPKTGLTAFGDQAGAGIRSGCGANLRNADMHSGCASLPLGSEYRVPDSRHSSAMNTQTPQVELSFADAVHQFNTGDRDNCVAELLEPQHHSRTLGSYVLSMSRLRTNDIAPESSRLAKYNKRINHLREYRNTW